MGLKYLSLILYFSFYLQGVECPLGFVEIEEVCFNKKHIDVLQDFIDLNHSLKKMHPQKIGYQEWTNNQLTFLSLGNYNIEVLPDSIGLLKDLLGLDLRKNNIKSIPVGLCNIYPFYTELNLSGNQICPPYPYCFDFIGNQNTKDCREFKCPKEYMEIDGEGYDALYDYDTDEDGLPNYSDPDDDGDGKPTRDEIIINEDGSIEFPDSNGNGTPDYLDPDTFE